MNDAEARLAERLAKDIERILETGILVQDLEIRGEGPVSIDVTCLVDGVSREIHVEGETVREAMSAVVRLAAESRQAASFWRVVGP